MKPDTTDETEYDLDELIEEATVDAYDEEEQAMGFCSVLDDEVTYPFTAHLIGETVSVTGVEQANDNRIVATCERNGKTYRIGLLDLEIDTAKVAGGQWIAAYRAWASHV